MKQKNIIMKKLLFLFLTISAFSTQAQKKYDDLLVLYADGNYEKLVKSAEKYTLKESTEDDPMPYLWLAKGLYAMSKDAKYTTEEKYEDAYKDAISAAGKFKRKDENGSYKEEAYEFMNELKASLMEVIQNEFSTKNYSRGYSWVLKLRKIALDNPGYYFLKGACLYRKNNKSGARIEWKTGNEMLDKIKSIDDWSKADLSILKMGVIETAMGRMDSRQEDEAKALLNKVKQWFEEDDDFMAKYDQIVN